MIIQNAYIYTPQHRFVRGDLCIRGGRIVPPCAPEPGETVLDAAGLYALPGLVDIHFHGAVGHDFCDADEAGLQAIADFEASKGVLAICPATMTFSEEILSGIMDTAKAHKNERGADLVGINMEGPFISPSKIGAQNPKYVMGADAAMFRRLQARSGGLIKLVDLAPEEAGALDFIRACGGEVRVSIAHTCTDYDTAKAAFAAGARHMTHLYNAMPGITHRAPGPIVAALEEGATVELITDGVHIHPAMVRFTFRVFGDDHVVLIADSMEAAGLPDGQYSLGGQAVTVRGPRATLTEHPDTIAGSATCLYDCMRTAVLDMGVPLESAVRAASENPARCIGIDADYGSLAVGRYGNVVLAPRDVKEEKVVQPLKDVIRIANAQDDKKEETNRKKEREAYKICQKKIREHNLEMKLIDVEYTFDNNKILFYFTADGRIDFRELVKDLAAVFKTRIELRQIGVRDETKILGGIGICGRELCCHTFLSEFAPVSIKMAKEQNLSLNPSKISGVCGRLMCCLKNEEENYEELNRKLPNTGDRVTTPEGLKGEVQSVNVIRQLVKVIVDIEDEKEVREYQASELKFKSRQKKDKIKISDEEMRALKELEKDK